MSEEWRQKMAYQDQPIASQARVSTLSVDSASPIRDGVTQSEQFLSEIHECIDALEKRLETVLTPQPPMPAGGNAVQKSQPLASHLSGRMAILNEGFSHVSSRLRELCRRVEI